MEGLSDSK